MTREDRLTIRAKSFRVVTRSRDDGHATLAKLQLAMAQRHRTLRLGKGVLTGLLSMLLSGAGFASLYRLVNHTPSQSKPPSISAAHRARPTQTVAVSIQAAERQPNTTSEPARILDLPRTTTPRPWTQDRLYERAHRLHFQGHNTEQALRAWEAYLQRYPGGDFAPEGRFNRAVCLFKLKRYADAEDALLPIAKGSTYHAPSARRLLENLHTAAFAR